MGISSFWPYTNLHDLNTDWLVKIVDELAKEMSLTQEEWKILKDRLENLFSEETKEELFEYMLEIFEEYKDKLITDKDLTSNDIDVQNLYNYIYSDGRVTGVPDYCVMQCLAIMPDGNFIGIYNDETESSNGGKIRVFNNNGEFIRDSLAEVGHANGCCTDGDYIYVTWMTEKAGTEWVQSTKVSKIKYPELTLEEVKIMPAPFSGIAYDFDNRQFIGRSGNTLYIMDENLNYSIKQLTYDTTFSTIQAQQDIFYYDGQICNILSYPNLLVFISLEDGSITKIYNPPEKIGYGTPFNEIEGGQFYNGEFYLCAFARLEDKVAYNNIAKFNPFKNTYKSYAKRNRYSGNYNIYVDGSYRGVKMDGSETYPFGHIGMAMSMLQSLTAVYTPISVYCARGTNVGGAQAHSINGMVIQPWGDGTEKYTIDGIRFNRCTSFIVLDANITKNNNLATGTASVYLLSSKGQLRECNITGDSSDGSIGVYGSYVDLIVFNTAIDSVSEGIRLADQSYCWRSGGSINATDYSVREFNSVEENRVRVRSNSKRSNMIALPSTTLIYPLQLTNFRLGEYDLDDALIDNYMVSNAVNGVNFAVFNINYDNEIQSHLVRIPNSGSLGFFVSGTKYRGTNKDIEITYMVEGSLDLSTKKLIVTEITCTNRNTGVIYKLSAGATGVAYPSIDSIYFL